MGEIWKNQIKKDCKMQSLRPIGVPRDYFMVDMSAITKPIQTKKVSEPTFLHQIKRCFGILFGLSVQVIMAFFFDINTNWKENYKNIS